MIVQVGPYPEPFGGISVYIQRMKQYMDVRGIPNEIWDISGIKKKEKDVFSIRLKLVPFKYLLRRDIKLIHYNICGAKSKIYIGFFNSLLFKNRKKLLTIHGDCCVLLKDGSKKLVKALNSFDAIICVKKGDRHCLIEQGVKKRIYEVPAFIPPQNSDKTENENRLSMEIEDFFGKHSFIICSNASSINFHSGEDLYGIDMCIRLTKRLIETCPNRQVGLIFCLPNINNQKYFEKMKGLIIEYQIAKDFLFVTESIEFHEIIKKSQLFLRATNTDGYSVSIAEALFFHVPSLVSDAVSRPKGTVLFRTRDMEDLHSKTVDIINNYDFYKESVKSIKQQDNAMKILRIYKNILANNLSYTKSV